MIVGSTGGKVYAGIAQQRPRSRSRSLLHLCVSQSRRARDERSPALQPPLAVAEQLQPLFSILRVQLLLLAANLRQFKRRRRRYPLASSTWLLRPSLICYRAQGDSPCTTIHFEMLYQFPSPRLLPPSLGADLLQLNRLNHALAQIQRVRRW